VTEPIRRPGAFEHLPYYAKYIEQVPPGDVRELLARENQETLALLRSLSPEQAEARYAPGKWSVKEVVGHLIDVERILSYRALRFARNDATELPGFEPDDLMKSVSFGARSLGDLADELEHLRKANVELFRHLDEAAWDRGGVASGAPITVRALAWIIVGHEIHHRTILRTKYL
jgi:uncharacterized damage-inducible protein DinB